LWDPMYMARQANNWECQPCCGSCWKTCPEIDHLWRERGRERERERFVRCLHLGF
jgi:hypothetical protein